MKKILLLTLLSLSIGSICFAKGARELKPEVKTEKVRTNEKAAETGAQRTKGVMSTAANAGTMTRTAAVRYLNKVLNPQFKQLADNIKAMLRGERDLDGAQQGTVLQAVAKAAKTCGAVCATKGRALAEAIGPKAEKWAECK